MQPFHNKIQVKIKDATIGGLKIARGPKEQIGEVIAIGPNVKDIKVGDTILFAIWAADIANVDGVEYTFVSEYNYVNGDAESPIFAYIYKVPRTLWERIKEWWH